MKIVTLFFSILFLNFKIYAQSNQKTKYNITQTGNNNKQYNTIINKEVVFHPDAKLMKQITDLMTDKSDIIVLKFNSLERNKNLAFTKELKAKLDAKGYNIIYNEEMHLDNCCPGQVSIRKVNKYIYIFVSKY